MANSLLVLVPHKKVHGTISILIQRPKLAANAGKMGAVKMPFIPHCPGPVQSAAAEMLGDGRSSKPTLFHRQSMRPHAEFRHQMLVESGHRLNVDVRASQGRRHVVKYHTGPSDDKLTDDYG